MFDALVTWCKSPTPDGLYWSLMGMTSICRSIGHNTVVSALQEVAHPNSVSCSCWDYTVARGDRVGRARAAVMHMLSLLILKVMAGVTSVAVPNSWQAMDSGPGPSILLM